MNGKTAKKLRKEARAQARPMVEQEAQRLAAQMQENLRRCTVARYTWWMRLYVWAQRLWVKLGGTPNIECGKRLAAAGGVVHMVVRPQQR